MAKQKTRKSAAKRFKITAKGKILHRSQQLRHLRSGKSKRRLRDLKQLKQFSIAFAKKAKKMLGI